jgi:hypothetical protein
MMKASSITFCSSIVIALSHQSLAAGKVPDNVGIVQAGQFTPPPDQLGKSAYIELKHQQQEKNLCVPTSAAMVMDHFGSSAVPREIKALAEGKRYDPTKDFKDFTMTLFPHLISGAAKLGFAWRMDSF